MATLRDYQERIERASSKSELLEILKELRAEFDENEPEAKELVKKLTR
ncbi:MAG: hypothetical protein UHM23_04740 [Clostridia bacterium]|nr:hypothetical protein [Clostridia bacterium]